MQRTDTTRQQNTKDLSTDIARLTLFFDPQAPAFRPEIGPFLRFNLAFSAARYTAG